MIFYNHARKIMFIPFPFVHSQIVVLFIVAIIPAVPFLMTQYTDEVWLGAMLTFGTVLCLSGINEVARELENPFRNIPNELPLVTFQVQVNEALHTMFAGYHPDFFWDGDRVLRHVGKARNKHTNLTDGSNGLETRRKNNGHEAPTPSSESFHKKTTEDPSNAAECSLPNIGESNSHILSVEAGKLQNSGPKKIKEREVAELKRQLAEHAKLIEHLCMKIVLLEEKEIKA
jgi:hypothetical protein